MPRLPLYALLTACAIGATPAGAMQAPAPRASSVFAGTVVSDLGHAAIGGAGVTILELNRLVVTDAQGTFKFGELAAGDYHILAQKLGFRPLRAVVRLEPGRPFDADLELEAVSPQQLEGVAVVAAPDRQTMDVMRRRAAGSGTFFLRDVLDSAKGTSIGALLQRQAKGAKLTRYSRTGAMLLSTGRGIGTITLLPLADPRDMRSPRACYAQVFVDGLRIYAPDAVNRFPVPDLDQYDSATLEAAEFYAGPAETPTEFAGVGAQCGTLVLWTRRSR